MKAIIERTTGKLLYTSTVDVVQSDDIIILEDNPTGNYWDFNNQVWYNDNNEEDYTQLALDMDIYYTELISQLLKKHIEKKIIEGIEIPQYVLDERDRLRAECNQKILDLGLNNFNYRKQNIRL